MTARNHIPVNRDDAETRPAHFCPNCGYNQTPDPIVEMAGWRIDPRNMAATFNGERVHFTPSEFVILHTLVCAGSNLVSRDALMERMGSEADSNSLQVLLFRVRSKIAGTPIEILTIRRAGMRLVEKVAA